MLLNTIKKDEVSTTEKFQNAEQLWFWFLYSKSIQNGTFDSERNYYLSELLPAVSDNLEKFITFMFYKLKYLQNFSNYLFTLFDQYETGSNHSL